MSLNTACRIRKAWVSNPCAIVTVIGFQRFIRFYFVEHLVIALFIFARNKRCHAAHRKSTAFMAGFDQQALVSIREDGLSIVTACLSKAARSG